MSESRAFNSIFSKVKHKLDEVSPTLCLAKWKQTTLNLHTGTHSSCCLSTSTKIPREKLLESPEVLHNTEVDFEEREMMMNGVYPTSCSFCWKQESRDQREVFTERLNKSHPDWAQDAWDDIKKHHYGASVNPSYLEMSFSNKCNFKCIYCYSHTSSTLYSEIKKYGTYPDSTQLGSLYGNFREFYDGTVENPYADAFWKWLPQIYKDLRTLRVTGGEPLLDNNLFKLLNYVIENPNEKLEFSINSNLGVNHSIIQRFVERLNGIKEGSIRGISVVTSIDCWGDEAEYIRYGLDLKVFKENIEYLLDKLPQISLRITATITILATTRLKELFDFVIDLKKRHPRHSDILLTSYPIINPSFLALNNLGEQEKQHVLEMFDYMKSKHEEIIGQGGFNDYEITAFGKVVEAMLDQKSNELLSRDRGDFYFFINEYDKRKALNFDRTYPELRNYFRLAESNSQELVSKWKQRFEHGQLVDKIDALKNLMRVLNAEALSFVPDILLANFERNCFADFIKSFLEVSQKHPHFEMTKLSFQNEIVFSERAWFDLFNCLHAASVVGYGLKRQSLFSVIEGVLSIGESIERDQLNSFLVNYLKSNLVPENIIGKFLLENHPKLGLDYISYLINFWMNKQVASWGHASHILMRVLESIKDRLVDRAILDNIFPFCQIDEHFNSFVASMATQYLEENPFDTDFHKKLDSYFAPEHEVQKTFVAKLVLMFEREPQRDDLAKLIISRSKDGDFPQLKALLEDLIVNHPYDDFVLNSVMSIAKARGVNIEISNRFLDCNYYDERFWEIINKTQDDYRLGIDLVLCALVADINNPHARNYLLSAATFGGDKSKYCLQRLAEKIVTSEEMRSFEALSLLRSATKDDIFFNKVFIDAYLKNVFYLDFLNEGLNLIGDKQQFVENFCAYAVPSLVEHSADSIFEIINIFKDELGPEQCLMVMISFFKINPYVDKAHETVNEMLSRESHEKRQELIDTFFTHVFVEMEFQDRLWDFYQDLVERYSLNGFVGIEHLLALIYKGPISVQLLRQFARLYWTIAEGHKLLAKKLVSKNAYLGKMVNAIDELSLVLDSPDKVIQLPIVNEIANENIVQLILILESVSRRAGLRSDSMDEYYIKYMMLNPYSPELIHYCISNLNSEYNEQAQNTFDELCQSLGKNRFSVLVDINKSLLLNNSISLKKRSLMFFSLLKINPYFEQVSQFVELLLNSDKADLDTNNLVVVEEFYRVCTDEFIGKKTDVLIVLLEPLKSSEKVINETKIAILFYVLFTDPYINQVRDILGEIVIVEPHEKQQVYIDRFVEVVLSKRDYENALWNYYCYSLVDRFGVSGHAGAKKLIVEAYRGFASLELLGHLKLLLATLRPEEKQSELENLARSEYLMSKLKSLD